jgi:hypothetical protein
MPAGLVVIPEMTICALILPGSDFLKQLLLIPEN